MKFCNRSENIRRVGAGRRIIALLMVLLMITASLPVSGGYYVSAEGASGSDAVPAAVQEVSPEADKPVSGSDPVQEAPAQDEHVCVITGFGEFVPGQPLDTVVLQQAEPLNRVRDKLPRKLSVAVECEDCPTVIDASWQNEGVDCFRLDLDESKYRYEPQDDPETEDIDESTESPWCDLPYITVSVEGMKPVSSSDAVASGSDVVTNSDAASGSDAIVDSDEAADNAASGSDVVTGSDVASDSDVTSGSDAVSGSDASGKKPADGNAAQDSVVSGSDSQVLPLCTCTSHCYANTEAGLYLVNIKCPACSLDPSGCMVLPEPEELTLQTVAQDGRTVSVSGMLPPGAVLRVSAVPEDQLADIINTIGFIGSPVVSFAYDITIVYEDREYQPVDFGTGVRVSVSDAFSGSDGDLAVFHVAQSGIERVDAEENDSAAVFSTDSFSVFVALSTDISDIYYDGTGFYSDSAMQNQLAKDGAAYTTISSILADTTGSITFHMAAAYSVSGTETVNPGAGRSIALERFSGNDGNIIVVASGGNLTLSGSVAVDGKNLPTLGASIDVSAGGSLIINDGVSVVNGENIGVLIRYGSTFTMNGGLIANNKAVNGAGVYNVGTTVINGGTISGNTSEHSGGAVWQEGTFTMNGGTMTGNTCGAMFGGALFAYGGTTAIAGGTVTGNTGSTYPQANGISTYSETSATVIFSGSPRIEDNVYVNVNSSHANVINVVDTFAPQCPIVIDSNSATQNVVQFNRAATASDLALFVTRSSGSRLVTNGNFIQITSGGRSFYGSDSGTKSAKEPNSWRLFINTAYNVIRTTGGTMYMSHGFSVNTKATTTNPGVTVSGSFYKVQNSTYETMNSGKSVLFRRWERPAALNATANVNPTNSNSSLFIATESGALRIQDTIVDGGSQPGILVYNNTQYQMIGIKSVTDATLLVQGSAVLEVQGNVVLRNAPHSPQGGAIRAASGTLNLSGTITFANNGSSSTMGKAVYVQDATVNINTPNIINPGNEDFYLSKSTSKLTIKTNLTGVIPVTVNPADSASCAPGRVIATYASGYTPDASKFVLQNVDLPLVVSGQNIVIGSYEKQFTAHAEDITPDAGESRSFTVDLAALYGGMGNVTGKNVSISNFAITSGSIVIGDYQVVEANRRSYGYADSNKYFGVSAELDGTVQDIQSVSMTAGGSGKLVFTVHNGNAITLDGTIATFSFQLNVGGSVRYINVTLNAHSGCNISAAVPVKITGVVDARGEFTLPDGSEYYISNKGTVPLVLTDVEWTWLVDGGYDANELFGSHENITMAVTLGGADSRDFGKTQGYQWSGIRIPIPAGAGDEPGRLSLDWTMKLGTGSYIRSARSATIANITYTIAVKE